MTRVARPRPFPMSKVCDMADLEQSALQPAAQVLAQFPELLAGQHAVRQWEYTLAIYAIEQWGAARAAAASTPLQIADLGGAGSHFWQPLASLTAEPVLIIDPHAPVGKPEGPCTVFSGPVEEYAATGPHEAFDILTCVSVIEHVPEPLRFLRACRMLLKPGGLLFLTTDYWDADGDDVAHFHWMRERIYNAERLRRLVGGMREIGFKSLGHANWTYHGPQVYDYSVASLAMVRS